MKYRDLVKEVTSTTGTGIVSLEGAASVRERRFYPAYDVGDLVPYAIRSQDNGEWEIGVGTLTTATTLTRTTVLASSSGGIAVNFTAGAKDVFVTQPGAEIEKLAGARATEVTAVADDDAMKVLVIEGGVPKQITLANLIAQIGINAASLPTAAPLANANIVTLTQDGVNDVRVSLGDLAIFLGAAPAPTDTVKPTVSAAAVANASPTIVTLTVSELLDYSYVPAPSVFTIDGHTATAVAISGSSINIIVSAAFVNGEAARTIAYTPNGTDDLRDVAGNLMLAFTARAIANNVGVAATVPAAPTIGTAVAGDGYVDVYFTVGSTGGSPILDHTATLSTGETATGPSSPIRVTAANGTARTGSVTSRNAVGSSAASAASNSVTPAAPALVSYTFDEYSSNVLKTTFDATSTSSNSGKKYILANATKANWWVVSPTPASLVAGWGTSNTVAPAEITIAQNNTGAGGNTNGMRPGTDSGGYWTTNTVLYVPVGSGTTTWYWWMKCVDGAAVCVNAATPLVVSGA